LLCPCSGGSPRRKICSIVRVVSHPPPAFEFASSNGVGGGVGGPDRSAGGPFKPVVGMSGVFDLAVAPAFPANNRQVSNNLENAAVTRATSTTPH
jgi:hypothetical protein